jgi:hypothetical protein
VQIVDEQDGGAVLSGRILIFAVEFLPAKPQPTAGQMEERDNDNVPNAQFMYI